MKTKNGLIAFMIWAIRSQCMNLPIERGYEVFKEDAWKMYKTFTDPSEEYYCKNLVGKDYVEVFIDYIMIYAKMHVQSGIISYGGYDKHILRYKSNI